MNLRESDITSNFQKETILIRILSSKANIYKLIQWSVSIEQPLGWRATWLLKHSLTKNDINIPGHLIQVVIDQFSDFNHSQKREWLKILDDQSIDENLEGMLFDLCIHEWIKINNQSALRSAAFHLILKSIKKFPDLKNEVAHLMTPEYISTLSDGIRKGVIKHWNSLI